MYWKSTKGIVDMVLVCLCVCSLHFSMRCELEDAYDASPQRTRASAAVGRKAACGACESRSGRGVATWVDARLTHAAAWHVGTALLVSPCAPDPRPAPPFRPSAPAVQVPHFTTFSAVPHPDVKPMAYANSYLMGM